MSRKLLKSTGIVSLMTLLSRIMGMVREIVFAYLFGASAGFDAFLVAFKIPNFMRRIFAEGAFSQAFVPVLATYKQQKGEEEARVFVARVAGSLAVGVGAVSLIASIIAPLFVILFAPGYLHAPDRFALASHMLHITFPYLLLISLTAFSGAVLNTYGRFAVPAVTPVLLNVALIFAAFFLSRYFHHPVVALAWGVLLGGVLQYVAQLPFLKPIHMLTWPQLAWRDPGVRRVLSLMLPAIFGVSIAQVSLLLDTLFASFLPVGSLSWLYYSDRMIYFPLGIFGVALATVVLPQLSIHHADNNEEKYSQALDWALRNVLLVGIPAGVGIAFLAGPMLATLFGYGRFSHYDILMSRESLMAYAFGLPAFMLIKVLASGFYSRQNIKTPVRIAVVALTANIICNLILIWPLKHAGLALSTALSSWVNAGCLWVLLLRRGQFHAQPGWLIYAARLMSACAVMGLVLYWLDPGLSVWMAWHSLTRAWHLLGLIIVGISVLLLVLLVSGFDWGEVLGQREIEKT